MTPSKSRYGIRGSIESRHTNLSDLVEDFIHGSFTVKVLDNVIEIGFENEGDLERAIRFGKLLLDAWSLQTGLKIIVNFNQSWQPTSQGGRLVSISLNETIKVSDRLKTTVKIIRSLGYVIKLKSDSHSFSNNIDIVSKAVKDETLARALDYFSQEVIENEKPLYGVYKAIEVITKKIGTDELARLAGKSKTYISDITQTAQPTRHSITVAKAVLSESECKSRAKALIQAYAGSL